VKDAAQDVTQDVAEDVSGAAEDGSVKVFIVARVIFHRPLRFPWATREGRARQGRGAGRCGGRALGRCAVGQPAEQHVQDAQDIRKVGLVRLVSSSAKWKPPSLKRPTSICFVVLIEE